MSNLVPTNVQLPAHLSGRIGQPSAIAGAMTAGINTGGAGFKRISIRGSRFRIREGATETVLPDTTLRAVIVGASPNLTKIFYKKFDPKAEGEDKKPDCFSNDGVRPAKDAQDPQSQLCATCPQNAWGSKVSDSGGKMKACADQKRLAIISADASGDDPEVYLFQVTPSALRDFATYGEMLSAKGFPPETVITEISFDPKVSHPKAQFKFAGFIKEDQLDMIDKLVQSDQVLEIIGEKAEKAEVVAEAPKPSPVKAKAVEYVPPPVVVEDAVFEEAPKPKTNGFGGTSQGPAQSTTSSALSKDIQDILSSMKEEQDD